MVGCIAVLGFPSDLLVEFLIHIGVLLHFIAYGNRDSLISWLQPNDPSSAGV